MVVNCYFGIYDGVYVHEVFEGVAQYKELDGDAMFMPCRNRSFMEMKVFGKR